MIPLFLALLDNETERQRFRILYEHHHARMEHFAMALLRNQRDAEDAIQSAWLQVICHFDQIPKIPCEKLPFWLITIVRNESLMLLRKRKTVLPLEDWIPVEAQAGQVSNYKELVELFTRLPETYRAALEMKLLLGYTDAEIAQHLGLSVTAVSTRINRGRRLLQEILTKEGFHP